MGVSRPTPGGKLGGLAGREGGLQAHTQGGSPGPGGVSQHALRQTPPLHSRRLLLRAVHILLECILFSDCRKSVFSSES